jgi:flagellar motor switch protein FliM
LSLGDSRRMTASVKKYDFSRLEAVSSSKLELNRILGHYVLEAERPRLIRGLEQVLQQCVRGGCTLHSKGFRLEAAKEWQQRLGEEAVYAVLSAVPGGPKAVIVWEPVLALSVIDRMLAGELSEIAGRRPLSEIERGVLSYVMAKLCQACHRYVVPDAMPIRLEGLHEDTETVIQLISGAEQLALAEMTLALPELSGVIQIVLPDLFIREVMLSPKGLAAAQQVPSAEQVQRLHDLGDLSFLMRASIGSATLRPDEILHLEPGDIVLLDESHCHYDGKALSGNVVFHPARHGAPTIVASIQELGPPAKVEVKDIYREA